MHLTPFSASITPRDTDLDARVAASLRESSPLLNLCFTAPVRRTPGAGRLDPPPRAVRAEFKLEDFERTLREGGDTVSMKALVARKVQCLRRSCHTGGDTFAAFSEATEDTVARRQAVIRRRMEEGVNFVDANREHAKHAAKRGAPRAPTAPDAHLARLRSVRRAQQEEYEARAAPYWAETNVAPGKLALTQIWLEMCAAAAAQGVFTRCLEEHRRAAAFTNLMPLDDGAEADPAVAHARAVIIRFLSTVAARHRAQKHRRAIDAVAKFLTMQRRRIRFLHAGRNLVRNVVKIQHFMKGLRLHRAARIHLLHRQWLRCEAELLEEDYHLIALLLAPHNPATSQNYIPYRHPEVCKLSFKARPAEALTEDMVPTLVPDGFVPFAARHDLVWRTFLATQKEQVKRCRTYYREAAIHKAELRVYQKLVDGGGVNLMPPPPAPQRPRVRLLASKPEFMELVKQTQLQLCHAYAALVERKRKLCEQERTKARTFVPLADAKSCGQDLLTAGKHRAAEQQAIERAMYAKTKAYRKQLNATVEKHGLTTPAAFRRFVSVDKDTYKAAPLPAKLPSKPVSEVQQLVEHQVQEFVRADEARHREAQVEFISKNLNFPELAMAQKQSSSGVVLFPPPSPPRAAHSRRAKALIARANLHTRPPSAPRTARPAPSAQNPLAATAPPGGSRTPRTPLTARGAGAWDRRPLTQQNQPRLNAILKSAINVSRRHPVGEERHST
eukprot:TRINITY_DN5507_c1_g1_i1.p1 TRINITY_DN5507_c1_g1~~TRINITY_DN5507_c1_g1_i1.p1  ORF type:complete len:787 (+),score=256.99 TRINITY_DN5507_c1_g1_i1:178-2361(+)